jgi:interleukin 10
LAFDIPNWIAVIIELGIGIAIAVLLFKLQSRTSRLAEELLSKISSMTSRVDAILEQRRLDEQSKKAFECKRIIDHLVYIEKKEQELKEYLTNYISGDTTSEQLQYFIKQNFMPIAKYRIHEIEDATRQLGDKLKDNTLRLDFLSYIEAFLNLSETVVLDGKPQNDNDLESFIISINLQLKRIQEFLTRFRNEIEQEDDNAK